ncbi:MAG: aminotransferase class III-fold pyridoxal phosphate-dependent enzyme [Planctomycetaceae bacterium]|nr:aminotransferase class III-fold pyridoxal phosphate-dependent enzyme [Planctomycetaceae bacterium]
MTDSEPAADTFPVLNSADVFRFPARDEDRRLFERLLQDFVPPDAFDAHAHLYDLRHLAPAARPENFAVSPEIGLEQLIEKMQQWMGDRVVSDGLYFPFPMKHVDCTAANRFLAETLKDHPGSRGLMLVRPQDDPAEVEREFRECGFAGFKVYHVFADRPETFLAEQHEFLPEWLWELSHQYGACIMMHMVLPRALADPRNQTYIRQHCLKYPDAKLILAHAARGFNAGHTVEGIHSLRGLDNVWYDTSAVCEPSALEAILETCGPTRLMYGSDFPVSELRGRCVSIGDGFYWLHDDNAEWDGWLHAQPTLVGIESLLALQQACRTLKLIDRDIEKIFDTNARQLLGLRESTGENVQDQYQQAKQIIPGGTQLLSKRPEMFAPGQWPAYFEQAIGCEVIDNDGRRLIDMSHCGILSCILGFADPDVNAAVIRRVHLGAMSTQQTFDEVELARLLTEIHPWADQARFTRSGGEAMAVAVRIARAHSRRSKLAVCGYHGWHDWYLAANLPVVTDAEDQSSRQLDSHLLPGLEARGVPTELAGTVETFRYNQLEELDAALARCGDDLAAIVMEPTRGVDPAPGFLEGVRERADRAGVPLIFDEISAGWRYCLGGAHRLYGVNPDLAVFAKAMSNGFAMGAIIGREEIMQACQESFVSSTYWTEGIGPAAAVAAIRKMMRVDVPRHLHQLGTRVMEGWRSLAEKHGLPITVAGRPASCRFQFEHPENAALLTLMTTLMLDRGYLAAGSCSITWAHQMQQVERYLTALDQVFEELAEAIARDDIPARLKGPVKHSGFQRLVD